MNQFEFISVFISIIFGLALAHVLTGAIQRLYHGGIGYIHLAYTVMTLTLLILNWWVLFLWKDHAVWTFETFLVLILWAMAFFSLSVATYPPGLEDFEKHRKTWLCILIAAVLMDIVQTAARGQLFKPWYYLILEVHYLLVAGLAIIMLKRARVQLVIATYMPASLLLWSLVVRHILA
jgi:hypothetical protein